MFVNDMDIRALLAYYSIPNATQVKTTVLYLTILFKNTKLESQSH